MNAAPGTLTDGLPAHPESWHVFCRSGELRRAPLSRTVLGRRLVAYRDQTRGGRAVVMDARCAHLGADLGRGRVEGEHLRCALHDWSYGPDGRCTHIPALAPCDGKADGNGNGDGNGDAVTGAIPRFARQACYPAAERYGFVFFFSAPAAEAPFPLPSFPDTGRDELVGAAPFGWELGCPWYVVGANHFDLQHFRSAHDRRLASPPSVDSPHPLARRAAAEFVVSGRGWRDRVTRLLAGPRVRMSVVDWCGDLRFVTARFRRTTTYGLVALEPLAPQRVRVRVAVFVRRARRGVGRLLRLDRLAARVRRHFVRQFLRADAALLEGVRPNEATLIAADAELLAYLHWLATISRPPRRGAPSDGSPGQTPQFHATPLRED